MVWLACRQAMGCETGITVVKATWQGCCNCVIILMEFWQPLTAHAFSGSLHVCAAARNTYSSASSLVASAGARKLCLVSGTVAHQCWSPVSCFPCHASVLAWHCHCLGKQACLGRPQSRRWGSSAWHLSGSSGAGA
jgi:hypothetical protein